MYLPIGHWTVLFYFPEDRSVAVWQQKLDLVLQFVSGHAVKNSKLFMLLEFIRYGARKVRPVAVRLRTVWVRSIILTSCNKLKDYQRDEVFISLMRIWRSEGALWIFDFPLKQLGLCRSAEGPSTANVAASFLFHSVFCLLGENKSFCPVWEFYMSCTDTRSL